MNLILRDGYRSLAISDARVCSYTPLGWIRSEHVSGQSAAGLVACQATVELLVPLGGVIRRALVGGGYTPQAGMTI